MRSGSAFSGRKLEIAYRNPGSVQNNKVKSHPVFEYSATFPLANSSWRAFAAAEQSLRSMAMGPGVVDSAETVSCVPTDTVIGESRIDGAWPSAAACNLGVFRPKESPAIYVLGRYADLGTQAQEACWRPLEFMAVGEKVGRAAAAEAKELINASEILLAERAGEEVSIAETRDELKSAQASGAVKVSRRAFPVIGVYDVVVVGGGANAL